MAALQVVLLVLCAILITLAYGKPQVPYDYIPIGRRDAATQPHPSDIKLVYEKLFPARRKWID